MAGQLPAFLNGSQLVVRIGQLQLALAQALSFSDNMTHQDVGGLGAFAPYAIEPTQYLAQGSLVITRWSTALRDKITANLSALSGSGLTPVSGNDLLPQPLKGAQTSVRRDGNSLLDGIQFNPRLLLLSTTFDIEVYQRSRNHTDISSNAKTLNDELFLTYVLKNCRLNNYGFSFAPATLLQETVTFLCLGIYDMSESDQKVNATPLSLLVP
jgi:hypothetical protein